MPKSPKNPSLGSKLKKELRANLKTLRKEIRKTQKDLISLGFKTVRKKVKALFK